MRINEIFYSLQGEGRFTGTPAVFVRFAGCNLKCPFCDTDHQLYKEHSEEEIMREIASYPANLVVITGGEPTLQLTTSLVDMIHALGKHVAIETNGTKELDKKLIDSLDWITLSPKFDFCRNALVKIQRHDELKVVYGFQDMHVYDALAKECPGNCYLQPCDVKDEVKNAENIAAVVEYIKQNPEWKLSLQTQKILNVR